jgi:hypothetical protein
MKKINQNITSVSLVDITEPTTIGVVENPAKCLNEDTKRPEILSGRTYKIKPPVCDSALYITLNDIVLNEGTEHESIHPFEIFIASKNMAEYQWVAAFTRVASAVFRKGGDVSFIVEELKSVQDPNGGYFSRRGRMSSVVAEIGHIIEQHFISIGVIQANVLLPAVLEKKAAAEESGALANATLCSKCGSKSVVVMDLCPTCLNCGDSKCS